MSSNTETLTRIVELLEPLSSDERRRLIKASLAFLGEEANIGSETKSNIIESQHEEGEISLPPKVKNWMKQNGLTSADIDEVFHFADEEVEVICTDVPGKNGKEKTHNAYYLSGLLKFLVTGGESNFNDKDARELCRSFGCYNHTNHAAYIKDIGNGIAGNKDKGWVLTAPGLKIGAALIKEIVGSNK